MLWFNKSFFRRKIFLLFFNNNKIQKKAGRARCHSQTRQSFPDAHILSKVGRSNETEKKNSNYALSLKAKADPVEHFLKLPAWDEGFSL
jgi:hypothetical protein